MTRTNHIYTAFCVERNQQGTTWIQKIQIPTEPRGNEIMRAGQQAKKECAEAWDMEPEEIHCLGLAYGNVQIVHWDDEPEPVY